jgi:hypothetical protein
MKQSKDGFSKKVAAPIGYLVIFIGMVGIILVFSFSTSEKTVVKEKACATTIMVSGVTLPEKIDFAGESVPIDNFDIKESLERELLINSYWHSQTLMLLKRSTRFFVQIEPLPKAGLPMLPLRLELWVSGNFYQTLPKIMDLK